MQIFSSWNHFVHLPRPETNAGTLAVLPSIFTNGCLNPSRRLSPSATDTSAYNRTSTSPDGIHSYLTSLELDKVLVNNFKVEAIHRWTKTYSQLNYLLLSIWAGCSRHNLDSGLVALNCHTSIFRLWLVSVWVVLWLSRSSNNLKPDEFISRFLEWRISRSISDDHIRLGIIFISSQIVWLFPDHLNLVLRLFGE